MPQYFFEKVTPTNSRNKCYQKSCNNSESFRAIFTLVSDDTVRLTRPICKEHAGYLTDAIIGGENNTFFFYNMTERDIR